MSPHFTIILCFLIVLCQGCSTVFTKKDGCWGRPMSGFTQATGKGAQQTAFMPAGVFPPIFIITLPLFVLNIVTSTVTDVVVLPADGIVAFTDESDSEEYSKKKKACTSSMF